MSKTSKFWLILIIMLGLFLRLLVAFTTDPMITNIRGGDETWYLNNGAALFLPEVQGTIRGYPYAVDNLPTPPLYLLQVGLVQQFFAFETAITVLFIIQSVMIMIVCYLAYDLAILLTRDERVGLVTAFALSLSLSMIFVPIQIMSETLYIFLSVLGIWIYCKRYVSQDHDTRAGLYAILMTGIVLGLATLTRSVSMLFVLGIVGHMLILNGESWKKGVLLTLVVIISFSATISTWSIYNWVKYDRYVIVSNQFFPALWRGAVEEDGSPRQNDALLGEQTAQEQATEIISADPLGFLKRRVNELISAYLQPDGTLVFGGQSIRQLALNWVNSGFSPQILWQIVSSEAFVPKLILYIWHYVALGAGFVGMWLTRDRWHISLVLIGFIAYTTLIHLAVLALPRYIFPTFPFYWIFASVTLVTLWDFVRGRIKGADHNLPQDE